MTNVRMARKGVPVASHVRIFFIASEILARSLSGASHTPDHYWSDLLLLALMFPAPYHSLYTLFISCTT